MYCVTDKELLAVRYFVEYFHHYLLGREFTVRTDHQALKWLFGFKEPKGRIARWLEILAQYQFDMEYRPGKAHGNADGLSRCPNPRDCQCPDEDNLENLKCGPCTKCKKRAEEMQNTFLEKHKVRRSDLSTNSSTVHMNVMQNEECQDFETNTPTESHETNFLDDGRIKPKLTENSCIRSTTDATLRLDRGSATIKEQFRTK